jgi:hypothetical protein
MTGQHLKPVVAHCQVVNDQGSDKRVHRALLISLDRPNPDLLRKLDKKEWVDGLIIDPVPYLDKSLHLPHSSPNNSLLLLLLPLFKITPYLVRKSKSKEDPLQKVKA